jgi:ankyrin repeat protein
MRRGRQVSTERLPLVARAGGQAGRLGDPRAPALDCVLKGDVVGLTTVLAEVAPVQDGEDREAATNYPLPPDHWVNQGTGKEGQYKTLLHAAVETGNADMVQLLLAAGCRADQHSEDLGLGPVHVAARVGSLTILVMLLTNEGNKAEAGAMMRNGRTVLHLAAEAGREEMVEYLLSLGSCPVDGEDLMGRQTPLLLAVRAGHQAIAHLLIEHGASVRHVVDGRSVGEVMQELMPGLDAAAVTVKVKPVENTQQDLVYSAGRLLDKAQRAKQKDLSNMQNIVMFRTVIQSITSSGPAILDTSNCGCLTLVQKSCSYGLAEFLVCLLQHGASPTATLPECRDPPVLLAAYGGHAEALQVLVKQKAKSAKVGPAANLAMTDPVTGETALHMVLQMPQRSAGRGREEGYRAALEVLLGDPGLEEELASVINKRDLQGNTPLHYATQAWPQATVRLLLERGANIGLRNKWGETAISRISPALMEDFLDTHCLTAKNDVHQEDFQLKFKYHFLAPPVDHPQYSEADPEGQEAVAEAALPETESLWHMAQSKEHRHLLRHPVITSFLWMKWQRISKQFNRNLRLYLLFVTTLTWYIFERFGGVSLRSPLAPDSELATELFCSSRLLGTDPARGFWFWMFLAQTLLQLMLILRDWRRDLRESDCQAAMLVFLTSWLEYFLLAAMVLLLVFRTTAMPTVLNILLVLVAFREGLQMMVSLKRYVFGCENWLELATIILAATILHTPDSRLSEQCGTERYLAAVALVLAWATLITLVGRHPRLSKYNIYVTMFYKILKTFATFLVWYSFFLIAFALGFYIMLHKDVPKGPDGAADSEDDYKFFNNPWWSIIKTSTMFVGEIEFSDIPISTDSSTWPLGYLYLLTFIFLIVVVLMNLLNGLAVSDTAVIQDQAEIVTYVIRVETISCFEAVLLGDPFNFLANWPAVRVLRDLPSLALCKALHRLACCRALSHRLTGATAILLFYTWLGPDKTLTLTPNKPGPLCNCVAVEAMGEEVVQSAKAVIIRRRQAALEEGPTDRLERRQQELAGQLDHLGEKLDRILEALRK